MKEKKTDKMSIEPKADFDSDLKVYAYLAADTSYQGFLQTIRSIRLNEMEKIIYGYLKKGTEVKKISENLNIPATITMNHANSILKKLSITSIQDIIKE